MTKEMMIKKSEETLLKRVIEGVKEKLYESKPEDLEYLIYPGRTPEEVVEFYDKNIGQDMFLDFYLEWVSHEQRQLVEDDEELLSIVDEKERHEMSYEMVDSEGTTYLGFLQYLYYITKEVIEELNDERLERYSEILEENGIESLMRWEDMEYYDTQRYSSKLILQGEESFMNIDDLFYFDIDLTPEEEMFPTNFEILHIDSNNQHFSYSFDNFKEFLLKLKELKSELDKKNIQIETEENIS